MSNELITIDKYCELNKTNLIFKRTVSKDEWMEVFQSLKKIEGCVQFWIGDCLKYREQTWGMYDDIIEDTGYDKGTLQNLKYVSDSVKSSLRNEDLSFNHHVAVAKLTHDKNERINYVKKT